MCKKRLLLCVGLGVVFGSVQSVSADLVGYWKFDEGGGTTAHDSSGNGLDGTFNGDPQWVVGQMGGALEFDGDDSVEIPHDPLLSITNEITVAAWTYMAANASGEMAIVSKGGWAANDLPYELTETVGGVTCWQFYDDGGRDACAPDTPPVEEWHHIAGTYDGQVFKCYFDGSLADEWAYAGTMPENTTSVTIGQRSNGGTFYNGILDEVQIYDEALSENEILGVLRGRAKGVAFDPLPEDEATDVWRDSELSWAPGKFAVTHDVYLGTSFDDVNDASETNPMDVLVSQGQDASTYDPARLDLGQTYFWRVDEVNGAPDRTVFKGEIWSFTAEPLSYPISGITVTASSSQANMEAERTVDGSGLDALDQHSTLASEMWLSGVGDAAPSIQYEFDKAYKLDQLLVWNSNQMIEPFIGLGAKDVVIEHSLDGDSWTVLEGATLFNQATGNASYTANTSVDFGEVMARYVKIAISAGWGMMPQYGLSEVRFLYIPTSARNLEPADGTTTNAAQVVLGWRPGREAASHEVYLGTDASDLPLAGATSEARFTASALNYGTTYYWTVKEVNEAAIPAAHEGPVWSFTTPPYGTVDSFDQYDDNCNRMFFAWEDGLGHNGGEEVEDCAVPPSNGNGGGSIVGNAQAPFAEKTIVNVGSKQSMPFSYDNSFGDSYATLTLDGQDWTANSVKTLALAFYGEAGNTGTLYVKINNTKVTYDRNPADIGRAMWLAWNIDLTALSGLQNVARLEIGVDGANAAGMLYIDDIRLYPVAGELLTPADPGNTGLVALYSFEGNANDSSGNGLDGAGIAVTYGSGVSGQAVVLDGFTGAVDLGRNDVFNPAGSFSVSLWANAPSWTNNDWGHVMMGNRGEDNLGWQVRRWGGNPTACFTTRTIGQDDSPESNVDMPLNEWVNVTAVYDNANNKKFLYFNGGSVGEADTNPGTVSATTLNTYIGARATGDNSGQEGFFEGSIDEVYYYDRALSREEVLFLAGLTDPIHKPL